MMNSSSNLTRIDSTYHLFDKPMSKEIINNYMREYIEIALNLLITLFGTLGVVTNAINIRVFSHQDLASDSNSISLFALAISDFIGCFLLVPTIACEIFRYIGITYKIMSCQSIVTLVCHISHIAMAQITCCITVYIAVERSLCVLLPFKVKTLVRPNVTKTSMILIYLVSVSCYVPLYLNVGFRWRFHTGFNATVVMFTETAHGRVIAVYMSWILNNGLTNSAIVVMAVSTGLMLYKLNTYKKWRKMTSSVHHVQDAGNSSETAATSQQKKDIEVLKTVSMVTGLFLVCLSMNFLPGVASSFVPGFTATGTNKNLHYILYLYKYVFDLVNSSLNFFFYFRVSSRYKASFNEVFRSEKR